jgi:hypothetical protein
VPSPTGSPRASQIISNCCLFLGNSLFFHLHQVLGPGTPRKDTPKTQQQELPKTQQQDPPKINDPKNDVSKIVESSTASVSQASKSGSELVKSPADKSTPAHKSTPLRGGSELVKCVSLDRIEMSKTAPMLIIIQNEHFCFLVDDY